MLPLLKNKDSILQKKFVVLVTEVKFEAVPVLNKAPRHEGVWMTGGITPLILNLPTRYFAHR